MESIRILQNDTERIKVTSLDSAGNFITGLSDVLLEICRQSDGFYLDFNDNTFKNSGWIIRKGQMTQLNAIYSPGAYFYDFNTTGFNDDTYFLRATSISAANFPAEGELKVGGYINNLDVTISSRADQNPPSQNLDDYKAQGFAVPNEYDVRLFNIDSDLTDMYKMTFNKTILTQINNLNYTEEIYEDDGITLKQKFNFVKSGNTETRNPA